MKPQFPRRAQVDLMTPAELAIRDAIDAVESLPADIRLTPMNMQPTAVSRAIADSISGGWMPHKYMTRLDYVGHKAAYFFQGDERFPSQGVWFSEIFLDKAFWIALGKARGWPNRTDNTFEAEMECWEAHQHGLIDAIQKDLSPEQFFLSLEGNEV